jgi:hypothetical protein
MTVDGKPIDVLLAREPEALQTLLGLYGEFYLALREWQALAGTLPPVAGNPAIPPPARFTTARRRLRTGDRHAGGCDGCSRLARDRFLV